MTNIEAGENPVVDALAPLMNRLNIKMSLPDFWESLGPWRGFAVIGMILAFCVLYFWRVPFGRWVGLSLAIASYVSLLIGIAIPTWAGMRRIAKDGDVILCSLKNETNEICEIRKKLMACSVDSVRDVEIVLSNLKTWRLRQSKVILGPIGLYPIFPLLVVLLIPGETKITVFGIETATAPFYIIACVVFGFWALRAGVEIGISTLNQACDLLGQVVESKTLEK